MKKNRKSANKIDPTSKEELEHGQSHRKTHQHGHHHHASNRIGLAFFLNFSFTIIELFGGLLTNSIAIISDAVHDFGDSLVLGISWILEKKSRQSGSFRYSFGYGRFRIAAALLTGIILLIGSLFVVSRAIPRLFYPEAVNSKGMLILAIIGVLVNGAAALQLGRGKRTVNLRMVSLHLLEDLLGWLAVLVVAVILMFFDWPILDPILSVCIAGYILYNAFLNLRETMNILLQATPSNIDCQLEQRLIQLVSPHLLHHLHIWTIDGESHVLSLHLRLFFDLPSAKIYALKESIRSELEKVQIHHSTIEVELLGEDCAIDEQQVSCRNEQKRDTAS